MLDRAEGRGYIDLEALQDHHSCVDIITWPNDSIPALTQPGPRHRPDPPTRRQRTGDVRQPSNTLALHTWADELDF